MEILQLQYDKIYKKTKNLINELRDKTDALYIIDKDLNTRVFFKYKENVYFLSDKFKIDIFTDIVDLTDSNGLAYICDYITNTFINSFINNSVLVKTTDIDDDFINTYMTDNLIIKVDRINHKILDAVSLEYYHELLLLKRNGVFKIAIIDDRLVKIDLSEFLFAYKPKEEGIENLLDEILTLLYKYRYLYPHNNLNFVEEDLLDFEDILNESILLVANVASNNLISYEIIKLDPTIDYLPIDIQETIEKLLCIDKNNCVIQSISDIMVDLSEIYENHIPGVLH